MWELGYSKGYVYAHDDHSGALDLEYMPEGLSGEILYTPKSEGFEKRVKEVMDARQKAKRDRAASYRRSSGKKG
jgi:putative ATPase